MYQEPQGEWTKLEDISSGSKVWMFGDTYSITEKFEDNSEIYMKLLYIESDDGQKNENPFVSFRAYKGAKLIVVE